MIDCCFFFFFFFYFFIFFFFFKQKTAYEILTCDWSSDVCSSDLHGWFQCFSVKELKVPMVPYLEIGGSNVSCLGTEISKSSLLKHGWFQCFSVKEIGRASCRERV